MSAPASTHFRRQIDRGQAALRYQGRDLREVREEVGILEHDEPVDRRCSDGSEGALDVLELLKIDHMEPQA